MITGRFCTAANMVSISRVPLAAAACYSLYSESTTFTFVFVVLAIVSDGIDGWLARKTGTVSEWGKILDPLADKVAFAMFAVTLVVRHIIPLWIPVVLVSRDLLIVTGGLIFYRAKKPPSSNIWGKLATTFLSVYMLRQAVFPALQVAGADLFLNTDVLGLFSMFLVILSFVTYAISASRGSEGSNAA